MTRSTLPRVVLVLRPFGYLLVTVVYGVILAALLVFGWTGLFIGMGTGFSRDASGLDSIVMYSLVVGLIGPFLGGALGMATGLVGSLTLLGGRAFVCSLNPAYADTTLTYSIRSRNAVGPPRLTVGVISLLPTKGGRVADLAVGWHLASQGLSWRTLLAWSWLGVADMVTAGWVKWPVTGLWAVPWMVVSTALVAVGVVELVRAARSSRRPAPGRPPRRRLGSGKLP